MRFASNALSWPEIVANRVLSKLLTVKFSKWNGLQSCRLVMQTPCQPWMPRRLHRFVPTLFGPICAPPFSTFSREECQRSVYQLAAPSVFTYCGAACWRHSGVRYPSRLQNNSWLCMLISQKEVSWINDNSWYDCNHVIVSNSCWKNKQVPF